MNQVSTGGMSAIGLALSGGGVRAAAFHAGVLRYLAEKNLLEEVVHVSSVSGGSLFVGLVFHHSNYIWPTSNAYLTDVLPRLQNTLTTQSLQKSAILRLVNPLNWRFILSRANVLAKAIRGLWGVESSLSSLSSIPVWSINCTTGETGRRFRFKNGTLGDYELGYAKVENFGLAEAMAISAAFPGGIGPLKLDVDNFQWVKRIKWGDPESLAHKVPFDSLHLYDGGVYDNLGTEPLFDSGAQTVKEDLALPRKVKYLLVSDAGAPLARKGIPRPLSYRRLLRIADIAFDQSRALRVRAFVNYLKNSPSSGAYVGIGAAAKSSIKDFALGREAVAERLLKNEFLDADDALRCANYSTTLRRLTEDTFVLLERHGYETAKWNIELMSLAPKTNASMN